MPAKLARRFIIPMLALSLLGGAGAATAAAQATVTSQTQTTTVDRGARTVTVVTHTTYSDGTWSRVTEVWSYNENEVDTFSGQ